MHCIEYALQSDASNVMHKGLHLQSMTIEGALMHTHRHGSPGRHAVVRCLAAPVHRTIPS